MKRICFVVLAAWLVTLGGMAQGNRPTKPQGTRPQGTTSRSKIPVEMVNIVSRNDKTYRLFSLADKLLEYNSFGEVAAELKSFYDGFKVEPFNGGEFSAVSDICEVQIVNSNGRPERIDTLTLFIKDALKKGIVKKELKGANYTFKKHSSTFDWWQRGDGTNLAIYYNYSDDFKTAMLFARPKVDELEEHTEPIGSTVVTEPIEENAVVGQVQFNSVKRERTTFHKNDCQLTVRICFPEAVGGIAEVLNDEALNSHLLGERLERKPNFPPGANLTKRIDCYIDSLFGVFSSNLDVSGVLNPSFEINYNVEKISDDICREGVIVYMNKITTIEPQNQADDYVVVSNFDRQTGKLLTFDNVFKKKDKKKLLKKLSEKYNETPTPRPNELGPKDIILISALDNFSLGKDNITFYVIDYDVVGRTYVPLVLSYEELDDYLIK